MLNSNSVMLNFNLTIFSIFLFSNIKCYSQSETLSYLEKSNLFVGQKSDSLFKIRHSLSDGKYSLFFDHEKKHIAKIFYLLNGNVTGLYREYSIEGFLTTGYYKDDSLWTFRFGQGFIVNNSINTFKRGYWYYLLGFQVNIPTETFKIEYDTDSVFIEKLLFSNDSIAVLRKYHQRLGLIYESTFYQNNRQEKLSYHGVVKEYYSNGILKFDLNVYNNSKVIHQFDSLGNLEYVQISDSSKIYEIGIKNKIRFYSPYNITGKYIAVNDSTTCESSSIVFNSDGTLKRLNSFDKSNTFINVEFKQKSAKINRKKKRKIK
jgi:hypothetical protein